jgi:hypothetical protein
VTAGRSGSVRAGLDSLIELAATRQRPLTNIVLGRRALLQLRRELDQGRAPTAYAGLPIRVRVDYATFLGVEGPLAPVRAECGVRGMPRWRATRGRLPRARGHVQTLRPASPAIIRDLPRARWRVYLRAPRAQPSRLTTASEVAHGEGLAVDLVRGLDTALVTQATGRPGGAE